MNRLVSLGAGCSLVLAALALTASPVRAQTPLEFTIRFQLTINGQPARGDSFAVKWGETGLVLCQAPCAGGGHTYQQTMLFPKGVTETFVFVRGFGPVTPGHDGQEFGQQTLTVASDRTVSTVFTYGAPAAPTPSTGSAPSVLSGAMVAGSGALLLLSVRRRRRLRDAL